MKVSSMMKWWLAFNAGLIAIVLSEIYGDVLTKMYNADATMLTSGIIVLTILTSIGIGFDIKNVEKTKDLYWFMSDAVLSLGMVGTLFGFLLVLGSTFTEIDTSSTESMTNAIAILASGMSTALVTSLVGLIASLWLKTQLVISEE